MRKKLLLFGMSVLMAMSAKAQQQIIPGELSLGDYNNVQKGYGNQLYFRGTAWNNNATWMARYTFGTEGTDVRLHTGGGTRSRFVVGFTESLTSPWTDNFVVTGKGKVGIRVSNPTYDLEVNGTIRAKEIIVETGWADFVFAPDYNLLSLAEVEAHIKEHKHLPNIPSEAEVLENGVGLAEMNVNLLQKFEELTLYMIQQNKEIEILKDQLLNK